MFHKEYPVCIQCRQRGNPCLLVQGKVCFGPLAHAGCNAPCPSAGAPCECCRGILDDANIDAIVQLLEKHGVPLREIKRRLAKFASMEERFKEVKLFHKRLG
jgi:sulfhydrogenase subunit delta